MSDAFENGSQFMESVVLDNVVFEDVVGSGQPPATDQHSSELHTSNDTVPVNNNKPSSLHSSDTSPSAPPFKSDPVFSSSFPETTQYSSSFTETTQYPSSYPDNSFQGTFGNEPKYHDAGAFAPEYHRESSFAPEPFRETTFAPEITSRAPPIVHREAIPIDVHVTEPEKFGDGMNSHITYKIKTNTTLPKFKESSVVARRYNDFLWFHDQLRVHNRGVLIPPLPEKALINRFSPEFIEIRRKELEKFLNRVSQHSILHQRPELIFFLEASEDQFAAAKSKTSRLHSEKHASQEHSPTQQQSGGGGFGHSLVSFIGHGISAVSHITANIGTAREIDQWFDAKKNYVSTLEGHLSALLKSTSKLLSKRKELASANSEFAASMSIVGSCEAESDSYISTSFIRIAQIADHIKDLAEQLFRNETTHFEEALRDYLRSLGAVRDMFADRDDVLLEYQNATRTLEAKKEKLDKDKAKKIKGLEKEVDDAQKKVDDTKRDYESITATVRSEWEMFESTRAREIRRMIALLVQSNMENSLQVVDLWKSYISDTQGSDEKDWKTADKIGWGGVGSLR